MASRPAGIVTFEFNPELNKLGKGKALHDGLSAVVHVPCSLCIARRRASRLA